MDAEEKSLNYDVVIVGAGISGLTAAYHLLKRDPSVRLLILEAKDRVGGRTLTVSLNAAQETDKWDLGGQWVARSQPHIMNMLEELGLETYEQFIKGTKFMQLGDFKPRTYVSDIPSLSVLALIDLQIYISKIEKMRKTVNCHNPWSCPNAEEWDSMTLDTFCKKTLWTQGARDTAFSATRGVFGVEPSQISLLYFLMYLESSGGLKKLVEATEFSAQEYKIKGGAQQISWKLSEKIGKENIRLNQPVLEIQQEDDSTVKIRTSTGELYTCNNVIMTLPPPALSYIDFKPLLPAAKLEIMRRMPKGNMSKIILTYKEAFWKERGHSGEVVSNGGKSNSPGCDSGPICIVFDATSHNDNPALVAFIAGSNVIQYSIKTPEVRKKAVLNHLSVFWGGAVFNYIDYREQDWNQESYILGCPVCSLNTGAMKYFADGVRKPFHRIHFAGTESATQWCGYMSGAVQSGIRAATQILQEINPNVVTDEDIKNSGLVTDLAISSSTSKSSSKTWLKVSLGIGAMLVLGATVFRTFRNHF